jgi:hypothetical protein
MRSIGWGLLMALVLAIGAPEAAWAAAKTADPAVTKDARDKGMAEAPGVVSAGGLTCQVSDARKIGEGTDTTTKAKETLYEVACSNNIGFVVIKKADGTQAVNCLQMNSAEAKPGIPRCILPGNADPKAALKPYLVKGGLDCDPDKVRAIGQSPTKTFFEVSCPNHPGGYILLTSAPMSPDQPATTTPCIMVAESSNLACTLTDRAAQLAVVDKLSAASGKPCVIKDGGRGFIAATQDGKFFYEEACQDGKGYVLEEAANGQFSKVIPCVEADSIAGGCKLTDSRTAKSEQNGLYTQLSKKAGFNCDVAGYAPLPGLQAMPDDEVVELKCGNRPDGAIGFFPASPSQPAAVYDCAHAEVFGYRCGLTKADASFAALTDDLHKLGKMTCTVSAARGVGISAADKKGYIEVGCADGGQGYMLEYTVAPPAPIAPANTIICSQATDIGSGCSLPGNRKKS